MSRAHHTDEVSMSIKALLLAAAAFCTIMSFFACQPTVRSVKPVDTVVVPGADTTNIIKN